MKKTIRNWFLLAAIGMLSIDPAASFGQELLNGVLGGQAAGGQPVNGSPASGSSINGAQGMSARDALRGVIRDQVQNAIQPAMPANQQIDQSGQQNSQFQNNQFPNNQNQLNRNGQLVPGSQPAMQSSPTPAMPSSGSALGLSLSNRNNGVFVTGVFNNGLAAQSGLRTGDQIISVNGNSISRSEEINSFYSQPLNGPVSITYVRTGQVFETTLNRTNSNGASNSNSSSVQSKLAQIERLVNEIRAELNSGRQ